MSRFFKGLKYAFLFGISLYLIAVLSLIIDANRETDKNAEYAVILGNKVELDGKPSRRLQARLDAGAELYRAGRVQKVIVSGGFGKEGYDEAHVMANYLIKNGIPADSIIVDHEGNNSHATSINSLTLTGKESTIIAVTQMYHLSRTKLSLRNAGFKEVSGHYPRYFELRDIYGITREIPAWVKYWIKKL